LKAQVVMLAELDDDIDWDAQVDATIVRTHQHGAGAAKRGSTSTRHVHAKVLDGPAAG
jgi:hypothetical protein